MYSVQEIWEEQERQYNQLMEEDDQYCHPESFRWGFEHGVDYALTKAGWHPASEVPKINKKVIGITTNGKAQEEVYYDGSRYCWNGLTIKIKRWCYPPEED